MLLIAEDGEVVPTNFVTMFPPGFVVHGGSASWWLRKAGTVDLIPTTIAFDADFVRVAPSIELDADAEYDALGFSTATAPVVAVGATVDDVAVAHVSFHTDASADTEAPLLPTIRRTETHGVSGSSHSECVDIPASTRAEVFVVVDSGDAAYELVRRGHGGDADVPVAEQAAPIVDGELVVLSELATVGGAQTYAVTSFDRAGNASPPAEVVIDVGLPGSCASAGPSSALALALAAFATARRHADRWARASSERAR